MAAEQNLITKGRLAEIKTAEAVLSENLFAHANASLSKAHGVLFYNLPHPTLDANGNDISVYYDSHGDIVGNNLMRITHSNVNYYVPIQTTTLAGKDPYTGITPDLTTIANLGAITPGGTAWVTDFTQQDQEDLIFTNDSVLLPHTLLSHWETHTGGVYQVLPMVITDSAGHRVSNYVARIIVDGVELYVPCDLRSRGPIQPIRVAFPAICTLPGTNANYCAMGRDDNQSGYFFVNTPTGGDLPWTFVWQVNSYYPPSYPYWANPLLGSGTWADLIGTSGNMGPAQPVENPVFASYSIRTSDNRLTVTSFSGNNSLQAVCTVRGKWTNAAGSVYTNMCIFASNDEDGSWIFSDPDLNQTAFHANIVADPTWVDGYYTPPGPP